MLDKIKTNVVLPLMSRIGTSAATVLVGYGVNAEYSQQVAIGVTAIGLVTFDLVLSWINRKLIRK